MILIRIIVCVFTIRLWRTNKNFHLPCFFRIEKWSGTLLFIVITYIRAFSQSIVFWIHSHTMVNVSSMGIKAVQTRAAISSRFPEIIMPRFIEAPSRITFRRSAHVSCDMNNNLWDDYIARMCLTQAWANAGFVICNQTTCFFDTLSTIKYHAENII